MTNFVYGYGPSHSPLLICAEAPGELEEYDGKPLVGPAGNMERGICRDAGFALDDYYRTNVEKVRPPGNNLKRFKEIDRKPFQDLPLLKEEIDKIRPNAILALGNHALEALTGKKGIAKWRGSILTTLPFFGRITKVVPTYHPAAFFAHSGRKDDEEEDNSGAKVAWKMRTVVVLDHVRALQESKSERLELPKRTLQICRSSRELYNFLYQYRNERYMSLDIEVVKCIPICLGIAFNSWHGMCVPLLNHQDWPMDPMDQAHIWTMICELLNDPSKEIIGQNWKFDERKIETILGIKISCKLHMDVGMAQHVLYPEFPKRLEFTTSVWTREPYYKDEYKEFDPRRDKIEQVFYYNCKDVCLPYEISEKQKVELEERGLTSFYFDFVNRFHGLYRRMEDRGFLFDNDKREELRVKYNNIWDESQAELNKIAGFEVNVASPKDVPKLIYEIGLKPRLNRKGGYDCSEAALVAILGNHAKSDDQVRALQLVLFIRRVRRTISAYINAEPDYDGRMRTLYNINGTESARTTTNIIDPPERPTKLGTSFQVLTKHGDIGPDYRKVMRADNGYVIGSMDLRQAEPRIVGLLSKDEWLLDCFRTGKDVHSITASWCFDKEGRVHLVGPEERFIGKCARNGYAYGEKKRKLAESVNSDAQKFNLNVQLSEWKAGEIIKIFDEKSPNIKGVFHREIQECAERNKYTLVTAFGRPRTFFGRRDDRLWNELYAYIPSATVADKIKSAMLAIEDAGVPIEILLDAHDAFAWQVEEKLWDETAQQIKEIVETPIDFSRCSLPRDPILIPTEFERGYNYGEMEKVKVA